MNPIAIQAGAVKFLREEGPEGEISAEQQKLDAFFQSIDDLIAAEEEKLAALKRHRAGLMQKLYPREGKTEPEMRFPGFEKTPWAVKSRPTAKDKPPVKGPQWR